MDVELAPLKRLVTDHNIQIKALERTVEDLRAEISTLSGQIDAMSAQTRREAEWDEERANNREVRERMAARNRESTVA
jgi:predicted RNase H-like nuclease (RuvC/YqgF family)